MSIKVKRNNRKEGLPERVTALESDMFRLTLVLMTGSFVVIGGLLGIIAALLALMR